VPVDPGRNYSLHQKDILAGEACPPAGVSYHAKGHQGPTCNHLTVALDCHLVGLDCLFPEQRAKPQSDFVRCLITGVALHDPACNPLVNFGCLLSQPRAAASPVLPQQVVVGFLGSSFPVGLLRRSSTLIALSIFSQVL
jgi:hypothetical protein